MSAAGVVLVTGALGGMGSASARRLASVHRDLLLTDIDSARLDEAAHHLSGYGIRCRAVTCDLTDPRSIGELVGSVEEGGGLSALVHTAAISPSMADWERVLAVDLVGTARLLDRLYPLTSRGSVAICFASIAAHMGPPPPADVLALLDDPYHVELCARLAKLTDSEPTSGMGYIWAKTAVVRMCERLAESWGRRGARIVSLSPGLIDTPMGRLELEENPRKRPMTTVTPLRGDPAGRHPDLPGTVEDIAAAVEFLCSDAASFITGTDLRVDGGFIGAWRNRRVPSGS